MCRLPKLLQHQDRNTLAHSNIKLRKWAFAVYLEITSLKSVSSKKLGRDIGVRQPTAWFMMHRIREAWSRNGNEPPFSGPVEVDETYVGGKRKNMPKAKREKLEGRGPVGKNRRGWHQRSGQ